ncbi:FAD-binding oxidoreductase [Streptomyces sp. LP05-1]|uniref:nitric oxide dioxygenase n=1 Tax=Streptomyces pyxinae TaxID=2970734 RepID=A0ABT2CC01_9ACTN|nr:globin domain-containing protein [Streptomyces sp. LP05-1]MCS0634938.1 FAD-binding oxidoreductase [Streptomyces sp. LP05-1]
MLTPRSAEVVRATLPVVGAALEKIAEVFYRRMFEAHPALLRDLFNRGNQARGDQRQALAGSIVVFATALTDRTGRPGGTARDPGAVLSRIAHKHVSLGVAPAQYAIVHEHLFAAIGEVLGEAVTDEVAAAWDEVYWHLARTLIALESGLYAERGVLAGDTWRPWTVTAREEHTPEVVTFRLRPADGRPAPGARAGQYVSVRVLLPDGARQIRQYSLISTPGEPEFAIAVKRVDDGRSPAGEVSHHLHDRLRTGDRLDLSAPCGDVVLDGRAGGRETPLLFASAGIGCTPMLSMLGELARDGHRAPVTVLHADRSPAADALGGVLRERVSGLPGATLRTWYEQPDPEDPGPRSGRMDLAGLDLPEGLRAYLCGPLPFMRDVRAQLLARGVPSGAVHYEVFGPDMWLALD